jgi:hypothetical protein
MENTNNENKEPIELPICMASSSCAEHGRLWDDEYEGPCDDGRGAAFTSKNKTKKNRD